MSAADSMTWAGVMPAITTPFQEDLTVDLPFLHRHAQWLVEHGSTGIVCLGSLGEGATLEFEEKTAILRTVVEAVGDRVPVTAAVSALSTAGAVRLARAAEEAGCRGLMVLPPYVHKGPWPEIEAHLRAVIEATPLSCMIYNNPVAYGTDIVPAQLEGLASACPNVAAVKESSGDVRRISAVRERMGDRLACFAGLDDMVVEACGVGAVGWVAGLVNALPAESVRVFELARDGKRDDAFALYRWFLPLLRLDTVPEFVQLIKLVQKEMDMGNERCRPPRQAVQGALREEALAIIRSRLADRPSL